ncbi:MAG: Asp23/Gls24 family envelope stress response protein [Clostridia bacterium]|nr:Asp23/Gls24 family envelope stress response protein [Clostridia bacterium]
MQENNTELSVSTQVLEKMATIAACEIEGVTGLSKKAIDIKGTFKTKSVFKGVRVDRINGALEINVFICIDNNVNAREVAEAVQKNVKDKIQTMTGVAVTKVNVSIADIHFEKEEPEEEQ